MEIKLRFDSSADPVSAQLAEQAPEFKDEIWLNHWDQMATAITRLYFNRLLDQSNASKARDRLAEQIAQRINRPAENMTPDTSQRRQVWIPLR